MFLMQEHDEQSDRPALCFGAVRHVNVQHEQHKLLPCTSLSEAVQTGLQAPDDMVAQIKVLLTACVLQRGYFGMKSVHWGC